MPPPDHLAQADFGRHEVWDLFEVGALDPDGYHDWFEIQRIDAPEGEGGNVLPPVLESDYEVMRHILARAAEGSLAHAEGLAFLEAHCPREWARVRAQRDAMAAEVGRT